MIDKDDSLMVVYPKIRAVPDHKRRQNQKAKAMKLTQENKAALD